VTDAAPVWPRTLTLALTGASGAAYGRRLLERLIAAESRVYLLVSQAAQVVLRMETGLPVPVRPREAEVFFAERFGARPSQLRIFGRQEWTAPVASGSNPADAIVVCPCTTGTPWTGRIPCR
jgi:flavin prenyltransferase